MSEERTLQKESERLEGKKIGMRKSESGRK